MCVHLESLGSECVSVPFTLTTYRTADLGFSLYREWPKGEASPRVTALSLRLADHLTQNKLFRADLPFELIQFDGKTSSCASVHPSAPLLSPISLEGRQEELGRRPGVHS